MELIRVVKNYPRVLVESLDKIFSKHHYFYSFMKIVPPTLGALVNTEDFYNSNVNLITDFSDWKYLSPTKEHISLSFNPGKAIIEFPQFLDNRIQQQKLFIESLINEDSARLFKSMVISSIISQLKNQQLHQPSTISYIIVYRKRWRYLLEVGILVENSKNQHLIFNDQEKWISEVPKFFNKELGDRYSVVNIPGLFHFQDNRINKSFLINLEDPENKIKDFIIGNHVDTKIDLT